MHFSKCVVLFSNISIFSNLFSIFSNVFSNHFMPFKFPCFLSLTFASTIIFQDDPHIPYKLFVGRLAGGTTTDDLRNYFVIFGELTDIYIPKPFRGFGFITFASSESVKRVMGSNHTVNGAQVYITFAEPKTHRDYEMNYHNAMPSSTQRSMAPSSYASRGRYQGRNSGTYSWHNEHSSTPRT